MVTCPFTACLSRTSAKQSVHISYIPSQPHKTRCDTGLYIPIRHGSTWPDAIRTRRWRPDEVRSNPILPNPIDLTRPDVSHRELALDNRKDGWTKSGNGRCCNGYFITCPGTGCPRADDFTYMTGDGHGTQENYLNIFLWYSSEQG